MMTAAALFASDAQAQALPTPFTNVAQVVCVDQTTAVGLLAVYEKGADVGEKLLAHLATRGACERATFSGKPMADVYPSKTSATAGNLMDGHVFEVEVTSGDVLKGRTRVYMLLYMMHDNEA